MFQAPADADSWLFNCWTRKITVSSSGTYSNDPPGGGLVAIRKRSS
jgi:hypothetical protein